MKIGKHLRKKRHEKNLSQQECADFINVSQKTYSNFESDNSRPSTTQLILLNELFEFDFLKLLQEKGNDFGQNNREKEANETVINNTTLTDKLITQYKTQINKTEKLIRLLEEKITKLKGKITL